MKKYIFIRSKVVVNCHVRQCVFMKLKLVVVGKIKHIDELINKSKTFKDSSHNPIGVPVVST